MIGYWRIIWYGIQGFRRNIWLSIIAIITMTLTITTITVFVMADMVAAKQYQEFNNKVDYSIFLKDSATEMDVSSFVSQLKSRPEVSRVNYLTKDDVRTKFNLSLGAVPEIQGIVTPDNNPLPRQIDVKFGDPKDMESFHKFVSNERFNLLVDSTTYKRNKGAIDNYLRITNLIKVSGIFFTSFFILIALMVIFNTIRLTIFARREEIEVMRLVGATRGYIRGPFLIEGVLFGLLGALFSGLLLWVTLTQLGSVFRDSSLSDLSLIVQMLQSSLGSLVDKSSFDSLFTTLVSVQVLVGIVLGILCSTLAVKRYLRD